MDNKHKPLRGAAKKKILVSDESLLLKLLQRVQKLKDKAESDRDESTLINKNHDYTFDKKKGEKKAVCRNAGVNQSKVKKQALTDRCWLRVMKLCNRLGKAGLCVCVWGGCPSLGEAALDGGEEESH